MTRRNKLILGAVAGALTLAGALVGWRQQKRAENIRAALPPSPIVRGPSDELRTLIRQADARARDGSVTALGELSRLYHGNGFLTEAMYCYRALEKLEPEEPRWLHRHASILAGDGDIEPALGRWRRVVELAPDYLPARLRLGDLLLKANQVEEAARMYTAALERTPNTPHAELGLARADIEAGRWAAARERLEKVVAQTDYALGYDLIVTVYEHLGLNDQAARVRSRAKASGAYQDPVDPWMHELLEVCHDPYPLALAAGAANRSGDSVTALRLLERATTLAPNDVAVRFQLATTHAQRHDALAAKREFERCTLLAPTFADAWAHLSALLEQGGDRASAERVLAQGLQHCPESPGLHLTRARQLRAAGRRTEAMAELQTSIRFRPNEAEAYVELATLLFQAERVDEGIRRLHEALEVEPEHPMALSVLTLHAISAGDEPAARTWLTRVRGQPRVPAAQAQQLHAMYAERFGRAFR